MNAVEVDLIVAVGGDATTLANGGDLVVGALAVGDDGSPTILVGDTCGDGAQSLRGQLIHRQAAIASAWRTLSR